MKNSVLYLLFLIVFSGSLKAQETLVPDHLLIGHFHNARVHSLTFTVNLGCYEILGDSVIVVIAEKGDFFRIISVGDSIRIQSTERDFGLYKEIQLHGSGDSSEFLLRHPDNPKRKEKTLEESLVVRNFGGKLHPISVIDPEKYIAGVVLSETGKGHHLEFYKAQAIISRTYAFSNTYKHEEEGFHLCDQVHCQVFKGKCTGEENILRSCQETRGVVVVDDSLKFITTVFHSNCGGQTANSEQVWTKALPYLRSVRDVYCTTMPNAYWTKTVPASTYLTTLQRYRFPVQDEACKDHCTNFKQSYRMTYLSGCDRKVAFKDLRMELGLKSAYFSAECIDGQTVTLKGRGFGHGVGLCQEGAMKMAKLGIHHKKILSFYFTGVHVLHVDNLNRFNEE